MAKFSGKQRPAQYKSALVTTDQVAITGEGGLGYVRDAKSELFLLAVTNMVGEDTFYEGGKTRDRRFQLLVQRVTEEDPAWVAAFVPYLREKMFMRSAAVVMACEYVKAGGPHGRKVVDAACQRADEPAEILAYWAQTYGRNFPQAIKRGVADAAKRLYNERSVLRYDGQSRAWRMGDVIEIAHPRPCDDRQSALFNFLLDQRHHSGGDFREGMLPILSANQTLRVMDVEARRALLAEHTGLFASNFKRAGFSWEDMASWLQGPMDARAWEVIIPSMGYMALLRNLRNFEEAGVREETLDMVAALIADPKEVAGSRQLPLRFFSAYKFSGTVRFAPALEQALGHSLSNVPKLPGQTLILIDVSGSMHAPLSGRSKLMRSEAALTFGIALGRAQGVHADVVLYDTRTFVMGEKVSLLRSIEAGMNTGGGGTATWRALQQHYDGHNQVVILTDEQTMGSAYDPGCPIYTFNLAGYRVAHNQQGSDGSHAFGGLSDAAFTALKLLSEKRKGWPWENETKENA